MTNETREKIQDKILIGLLGLVIGTGVGIQMEYMHNPKLEKVQIYQEKDKPNLMRAYTLLEDKLLVEIEGTETYIPLKKYLDSIEDLAERAIEDARIKKAVDWYESE